MRVMCSGILAVNAGAQAYAYGFAASPPKVRMRTRLAPPSASRILPTDLLFAVVSGDAADGETTGETGDAGARRV